LRPQRRSRRGGKQAPTRGSHPGKFAPIRPIRVNLFCFFIRVHPWLKYFSLRLRVSAVSSNLARQPLFFALFAFFAVAEPMGLARFTQRSRSRRGNAGLNDLIPSG